MENASARDRIRRRTDLTEKGASSNPEREGGGIS